MKARILSALVAGTILAPLPLMAQTPPDTLVMAYNIDAISTFDPAQIGEVVTNELIVNTCDSLVEIDPTDESQIRPAFAKSWDVSEDGKTITFHLTEGATFPSGNPVTAEDVVWSMQRVIKLGFGNSATLTEYGFTADTIDTAITAPDENTVQLVLDKPYPIQLVLQGVAANRVATILDKDFLLEQEVDGDLGNQYLTTNTACVGPYSLARWNAGEVVILEANDNYYGEAPKLKRWLIRHVPEAGAQRLLLEQGDIDVARDLGSSDIAEMEGEEGLNYVDTLKHQMLYLAFDNGQERFAKDDVRLAFKYLVDYDLLADTVMKYDGVPRASVVPIGAYGALSVEEGQPYSLDLDKAKELMTAAGYPDGFEARLFVGSSPYSAPIAQHIQANAAKIGITLNIEQMANAQLFSAFRGRDFDTLLVSWSTAVPHAHGMLSRHAVNPDNSDEAKLTMYPSWRGSWYNADFNQRVEDTLFEADPEKQLADYRQLELDHMEKGPYAYLFQNTNTAMISDAVKDWTWNAFKIYYSTISKE